MAERFAVTGPFSRAAALVHVLLGVEVLLLLTAGPGLLLLVLLDRDAGNLPLAALGALPAGPALSAALYALHHRSLDLTDLHPAAAFRRGYRRNARGVLPIWSAWLIWITVLAADLSHLESSGLPGWWRVPLLAVAAVATLGMVNALVVTSLFAFPVRDVVRLAAMFLVRAPGAAVGNACVLFLAALAGSAVVLLGSVALLAILFNSRRLIDVVREEFTSDAQDPLRRRLQPGTVA
ncbi:hypothetical protein [Actinoplanes sp. NPDC051851]|uniref:hypothetical protein n=1 Tax=Actinoplanes sp. NPDC051851 TaxID=3154753 RepID=UPI0034308590